jgi:hypothetical protein
VQIWCNPQSHFTSMMEPVATLLCVGTESRL